MDKVVGFLLGVVVITAVGIALLAMSPLLILFLGVFVGVISAAVAMF